jgi:hypothetical protein
VRICQFCGVERSGGTLTGERGSLLCGREPPVIYFFLRSVFFGRLRAS